MLSSTTKALDSYQVKQKLFKYLSTFIKIQKSQTLLLNEQSRKLETDGRRIYKFGFGQSPFLPPAHVQNALRNAVLRKDYAPVQGLPELCEKVANFHGVMDGYEIDPTQVLIGSGSKMLLYNTFCAFSDAVIFIPSPTWVSYAPQAQLAGQKIHQLPTNYASRWRVNLLALDKAFSQYKSQEKLLVLNYPGNPDGLTYSRKELENIAIVAKKHKIWILSDEIYGALHHTGSHVSVASVYPERTIVTSGLSKWCGAGGWRLGVQILPRDGPEELKEAVLGIASETYSCAPTPVQIAACAAYEDPEEIRDYLNQQRHILSVIGKNIHAKLTEAGLRVHAPQGGFYLMLDFSQFRDILEQSEITSDTDLCLHLLDKIKVALLPGNAFGMPSSSLTARMAYVDFDEFGMIDYEELSQEEILTNCTHMMQGIEKLCIWVKQMQLVK